MKKEEPVDSNEASIDSDDKGDDGGDDDDDDDEVSMHDILRSQCSVVFIISSYITRSILYYL